jgi:hypothetical protein
MLAQIRAGAPTLERRAYEKRTLDQLLDLDWTFGDLLLPFPAPPPYRAIELKVPDVWYGTVKLPTAEPTVTSPATL